MRPTMVGVKSALDEMWPTGSGGAASGAVGQAMHGKDRALLHSVFPPDVATALANGEKARRLRLLLLLLLLRPHLLLRNNPSAAALLECPPSTVYALPSAAPFVHTAAGLRMRARRPRLLPVGCMGVVRARCLIAAAPRAAGH